MAIRADMRKYHLLHANCQTFATDMIYYIRSDAATFTKPRTLTSYVERFFNYSQITPLHTFGPIAASIAVALLLCVIRSLTMGLLPWSSLDFGGVGITKFFQWVRCVAVIVAAFEVAMAIATFLWIRFKKRLILSANPKLDTRAQPLGVQIPNDEHQGRRRNNLGDRGDESETHNELHMRSSRAGQSMDCPETVLALSECAIRHSMENHNSATTARHDATHSSANKHTGIAHKPVQFGQPKKNQEQSPEIGDRRADAQVTAEVAQPLSEQADMVVRRRPRQRQRVIVLDVDEDTTAAE
jgi:hypothetical protein